MDYKHLIALLILVCYLVAISAAKAPRNKTIRAKTKKPKNPPHDMHKILSVKHKTETLHQSIKPENSNLMVKEEESSSQKIWSILNSAWTWIKADISKAIWDDDEKNGKALSEERTFGKIRRMQMAMVPLVFKFGFLYAMVAFLILVGLKTLFLVKMMVFINSATLLGKLFSLKLQAPAHHQSTIEHYPIWSGPSPYELHSSPALSSHGYQPNKEIHVHVHGASPGGAVEHPSSYSVDGVNSAGGWHHRNDPYVGPSSPVYTGNSGYSTASFTPPFPLEQKITYTG